jgi:decaprenylphospho-beta-D-erythro-pentofuranosid-2-ulose 2-reductase
VTAEARVLIFGATSKIAGEVAKILAQRRAKLHLVARNEARLGALAAELGKLTQVSTEVADLGDPGRAPEIVERAFERLGSVDEVYVLQGDLGEQRLSELSFIEAERILRVNLLGVVALLIPLANGLEARGRGRIVVVTSVAGDRGRPRNYTYGSAKGALNIYLQGLRSRLYSTGVTVITIRLGPVDTPMTENHPKNRLFGRADRVAEQIVAARANGEVYVPGYWWPIMWVVRNLPLALFQRFSFLAGR